MNSSSSEILKTPADTNDKPVPLTSLINPDYKAVLITPPKNSEEIIASKKVLTRILLGEIKDPNIIRKAINGIFNTWVNEADLYFLRRFSVTEKIDPSMKHEFNRKLYFHELENDVPVAELTDGTKAIVACGLDMAFDKEKGGITLPTIGLGQIEGREEDGSVKINYPFGVWGLNIDLNRNDDLSGERQYYNQLKQLVDTYRPKKQLYMEMVEPKSTKLYPPDFCEVLVLPHLSFAPQPAINIPKPIV